MKITSFDPIIVTKDAEAAVKLFEAMGFERTHAPSNEFFGNQVTSNRMKHPEGYHVDVVATSREMARDEMLIRMNVDDFEEAYNMMTARGYKNIRGDQTIDTKSATAATMQSPSGFRISIVRHIK